MKYTGGSTPEIYGIPKGATDLQDLIEYKNMNFAEGNMFKACYRLGQKNDRLYDLRKIRWFVDREIAIEEKGKLNEENANNFEKYIENVNLYGSDRTVMPYHLTKPRN